MTATVAPKTADLIDMQLAAAALRLRDAKAALLKAMTESGANYAARWNMRPVIEAEVEVELWTGAIQVRSKADSPEDASYTLAHRLAVRINDDAVSTDAFDNATRGAVATAARRVARVWVSLGIADALIFGSAIAGC